MPRGKGRGRGKQERDEGPGRGRDEGPGRGRDDEPGRGRGAQQREEPRHGRGRGRGRGAPVHKEPQAEAPPPQARGAPVHKEPQAEAPPPPQAAPFQLQRKVTEKDTKVVEAKPVSVPSGASSEPIETGFRYLSMRASKREKLFYVAKPPPGTLGRKIQLKTNHFPMDIPTGVVYHYDVVIDVVQKMSKDKQSEKKKFRCLNTRRNREVIDTMLKAYDVFHGFHPAFDGMKNLITRKPLPTAPIRLTVTLETDSERPDIFEVTIKPVQKDETNTCAISLDPLHGLFQGRINSDYLEAVMALEIILRHGPALRLIPVGRSFFSPPEQLHSLSGGREIWFGHHQSVHLGQWQPMLNIDSSATAFYERKDILDFICDVLKKSRDELNNLRALRDSEIAILSKELKQLKVEVTHMRYPRKYRVMKITREAANRITFAMEENGRMVNKTVSDYFRQQYNMNLRFPNFPCIQSGSEAKKVYLPLEVCKLVEGQPCRKKLNENQTATMVRSTAIPPKDRFRNIARVMATENFNNDPCVREFGIRISTKPMDVPGRVIEPPRVRYDHDVIKPREGAWDMRDKKFFFGATISNWVLISFANRNFCNESQLRKFSQMLCSIGHQCGMTIPQPHLIKIIEGRYTVENILKEMYHQYNAQLVVIVLSSRVSAYNEVKHIAETQFGLVTQCIKENSVVRKCTPQLVANLCQKINAKMGGVNNTLLPEEKPRIFQKPVIIIGADVSHPAPGDKIKPSIAAVVGSLDAHPSRYAVSVRVQCDRNELKEKVEIIQDLDEMVMELLRAFYSHTNGKKPEKIIFYRDGVSEGQFPEVRSHEIKLLRKACYQVSKDENYQPKITFIVVQKRHHTRIWPTDDRDGVGKMRNVAPGTTVDTVITHPVNFDFFLCSHFGIQGTSRPAHYTVLSDDNNFDADEMQKLTYYLCHIYARCTRSISIPVPVQYAHLAAFRARLHLINQTDISSASSDVSSAIGLTTLTTEMMNAVKVLDSLKSKMYFV